MAQETISQEQARQLALEAATLLALVGERRGKLAARSAELELLIHDALAREHRRAAFNLRDSQCYRLGGGFEPTGGLDLDSVTLTGLLALDQVGLLLLIRTALRTPDATLTDWLRSLFASPAGAVIRDHGVWVRWRWLRTLYVDEVEAFLASPAATDPKHRFRAKKQTVNQTYIIAEICRCLQLEPRSFATRGEAFEWILDRAGNPRFNVERVRPDLSALWDDLR